MFRHKKINRKVVLIITLVALGLVGGGSYLWINQQQTNSLVSADNTIQAQSVQSIVDSSKKVSAILSGQAVANNSSKIKIDPSKGEVKEVFVKAGDTVQAGQPLFSYSTSQELTAKEAEYDAQSKNSAVTAAQNTASIKWATYNRKLSQLNSLKAKYNQSQDESLLEQIKTGEDELAQSLNDAKSADSDVQAAQIEANKAQSTAQTEAEKTQYDVVKADAAGTVTTLNADLPNQSKSKKESETFMEIMDKSKTFITGEISEFDREKISVGQKVDVIDRKDPSKKWTGTVTQVDNLTAETSSDKQSESPNQSKYPYKVELDQTDNMPLLGSHAYVKLIEGNQDPNKLIINKSYVFSKNGKSYVWKVEHNKIKQTEVKVNQVSKQTVEITEGLSAQDSIASPKDGMTEGMEVGQIVKS